MHYIKFTKSQAMAIFRHCGRENDNYSNENIDTSRTSQNYNLGPSGSQWGHMMDRLKQLTYREQKNNIVLCSWVITTPKNLPQEKQKDFFKIMYDFMSKKYGVQNVISAHVHMDEITPHMHFLFTPGTKDLKLSASKLTNRITLQNIHNEAQNVIDKELGPQYRIVADTAEERAKGSAPVEKLKKALNSLETQKEMQEIEFQYLQDKINNQKAIIKKQHNEMQALKQDIQALREQTELLNNHIIERAAQYNELSGYVETKRNELLDLGRQTKDIYNRIDKIYNFLDEHEQQSIEQQYYDLEDEIFR